MQNKHRFLFFSLAGILAALLLSAAIIPVSGDGPAGSRFYESRQDKLTSGSEQTSPCMAILMEAAKQAGVQGTPRNVSDNAGGTGNQDCSVIFVVSGTGDPPPDATSTLLLLTETSPTPEGSCKFEPQEQFQSTTFHGYNAETSYRKGETRMVNDVPYTFEGKWFAWCMHKGERNHYITVYTTTQSIEKYGPAQDPLPIANALWSIAEDRLPLSEEPVDSSEQPLLPGDSGEVVPGQPEVPTDQTVPTEPGGLFGIPLPVFLGSLAIPMAGAFTGAVLSALWSSLSSAGAAKVGESLAVGADKLILDPVEASIRLAGLGVSLDEINQELLARNIYVTNPLQKVPFLVFDGLSKGGNWVWDHTAGWVTKSDGLTCDGYVDETVGKVIRVVREQYGADAKIENIVFEEKTTHNPQGVLDSIDSLNKDNHNLVKVTLPDGSEWAVDFHQHNTGSKPPILRPWGEAQKVWEDYMGDEFKVRTISVYE